MLAEVRSRFLLLPPAERRSWAGLAALRLSMAGIDMALAAAIYGLLTVLTAPDRVAAADPWLRRIATLWPALADPRHAGWFLAAIAAVFLLRGALAVAGAWGQGVLGNRNTNRFAVRLLGAYLHAPYAFHLRRDSAELIENVVHGVPRLFWIFSAATSAATETVVIAGLLAVVGLVAPGPVLATGAAILAVLALFVRATRARYARWGERRHRLAADLLRQAGHGLAGIKELHVLGREAHFARAFARVQAEALALDVHGAVLGSLPRLLAEAAFGITLLGAAALGLLGSLGTPAALPLLGLLAYVGGRALPAAAHVSQQLNLIRWALGETSTLMADLRDLGPPPAPPRDPRRLEMREHVALDGVTFAYEGAPEPALHGVSLRFRRGAMVGIAGVTGSGKTTLADLLLGLHAPREGRVLVDGRDVAGDLRAWQNGLGYVPQALHLVDDTLRRNVALGVPDEDIDEGRVREVIRLARLEARVAALPAGLDTPVGEDGARLSGGERQRIAVARALYHDPHLLVLDEATASLDPATECALLDALAGLRGTKTIVVISHRLSTLARCDALVLLEGGRVVAHGPYHALKDEARFRAFSALDGAPTV